MAYFSYPLLVCVFFSSKNMKLFLILTLTGELLNIFGGKWYYSILLLIYCCILSFGNVYENRVYYLHIISMPCKSFTITKFHVDCWYTHNLFYFLFFISKVEISWYFFLIWLFHCWILEEAFVFTIRCIWRVDKGNPLPLSTLYTIVTAWRVNKGTLI